VTFKQVVKRMAHRLGYDVTRYRPPELGVNAFSDIHRLVGPVAHPVIFDVGAHVGQTTGHFKERMPGCIVHAFEPAAATYRTLVENTTGMCGIYPNNVGVAARPGSRLLLEYEDSSMNSFLEPGASCWSEVVDRKMVPVVTIDQYCARRHVPCIDVLKSDTQGYDLEVLKGAQAMLERNAIHLLYMEITFSDLYQDLPSFDRIYRFLADNRFHLVSFYQFFYEEDIAGWSDALFINRQYARERDAEAARSAGIVSSDPAPVAPAARADMAL
jgi:FkbM family methyltransferase